LIVQSKPTGGLGPHNQGVTMKVIFTKQEVEEIIFAYVHREFHEDFNAIDFCDFSEDEYVTVLGSNKSDEEEEGDE
jgi:hypothetical protein